MVVEPDTNHNAIDNLISQYIPGSEVGRVHGKELDITLPHSEISNFAGKLFFFLDLHNFAKIEFSSINTVNSMNVNLI